MKKSGNGEKFLRGEGSKGPLIEEIPGKVGAKEDKKDGSGETSEEGEKQGPETSHLNGSSFTISNLTQGLF